MTEEQWARERATVIDEKAVEELSAPADSPLLARSGKGIELSD
jgi:hypothetical protein